MISHQSQATQPVAPHNGDSEALLQADRVAVLLAGYGFYFCTATPGMCSI